MLHYFSTCYVSVSITLAPASFTLSSLAHASHSLALAQVAGSLAHSRTQLGLHSPSQMLAWQPPLGADLVEPLADSHSLVRLLSGGSTATGTPGKTPTDGDVVLRNNRTQQLDTQWAIL